MVFIHVSNNSIYMVTRHSGLTINVYFLRLYIFEELIGGFIFNMANHQLCIKIYMKIV